MTYFGFLVCCTNIKIRISCMSSFNVWVECHLKLYYFLLKLTSTKPGLIHTREVSCFCDFDCGCFSPKEFDFQEKGSSEKESVETVLEVGKWVLVEYDAGLFPGTITQVCRKMLWYWHVMLLIINPESY